MTRRVAVVACAGPGSEQGGAERFYAGLTAALCRAGLDATCVTVPSDERDLRRIKEAYLRFYDLDLSAFDGVISTKGPSYALRHRNHVCYLMHTMRMFYDMFAQENPAPTPWLAEQRRLIHSLDSAAMAPARLRGLFAIGEEVAQRLKMFNGLHARVVRPPTSLGGLHAGAFRHVLLPGRLHRWKRVDLAIAAMRHVTAPVELVIPGTGDDAERLRALAAGDARIRFPGHVSDAELAGLYADSLAVLFMAQREDLGLVTFEAFGSGKPVITCTDSGEPSRIVRNGATGLVCPPEPAAVGARIERLARAPEEARLMGEAGALWVREVSWERVASALCGALGVAPVPA